jgi:ribosomal protein S18 acetylase RimI-like enzyme
MNDPAPAVFLPWDSEFFGARIARMNGNILDDVLLRQADEWCRENSIDCLYFLADPDVSGSITLAENSGFRLCDIRVSLEHVIGRYPRVAVDDSDGYMLRPLVDDDIPALMQIAGRIHQITRFWRDPGFPDSRCSELYRKWLERDVTGRADHVVVCEYSGIPVGYVTCLLDGSSPPGGSISLLGVHEDHRKRGMGSRLLRGAIDWFGESGVRNIEVVTQGTNIASLRVYQEAGFLVNSMMVWFHRWFA